jgi:hypothetical protein
MASFSLTVPLAPPIAPSFNVGAVAAAAPVALLTGEADALPFPLPQAAPVAHAAAAEGGQDGAAMRPDQVFLARQLSFPAAGGGTLAASWRSMVKTYGAQVAKRELQARTGQLPAALLLGGQEARVPRQADGQAGMHPDAWRFTVHAGGAQPQQLHVIADQADQPPGRRRRARAALRLELELADGTRVTVQVEPLPGGVALELCAPDAHAVARLRELQGALEQAVERAGLRVLRWMYRDSLPPGTIHARGASAEAANMLSLPVFRALAELALVLPAQPGATDMQENYRNNIISK